MRAFRKYLALLMAVLFFMACTHTEEVIVEKHPDQSPRVVKYYSVDDGIRTLVKEVRYYPEHKKMIEGDYKDNLRDGLWLSWYENGTLWSEAEYLKGVREGKCITYYENGAKRFEGQYLEGKKEGAWVFYDSLGHVQNTFHY